MTKNEALKAAIDGKKVRLPHFHQQEYVVWHETCFAFHYENGHLEKATFCLERNDNWEIVSEYVDFAEAWKAYEAGKTIKAKSGCTYTSADTCGFAKITMIIDDIRGKWLILEDE